MLEKIRGEFRFVSYVYKKDENILLHSHLSYKYVVSYVPYRSEKMYLYGEIGSDIRDNKKMKIKVMPGYGYKIVRN